MEKKTRLSYKSEDEKRTRRLVIYVTNDEFKELKEVAHKSGQSVGSMIRRLTKTV